MHFGLNLVERPLKGLGFLRIQWRLMVKLFFFNVSLIFKEFLVFVKEGLIISRFDTKKQVWV